jgi:glycosyltransferase involved in cell wall biosynthesis
MTRVLLVQPTLQPPGGSKGVAAWILEALKRDHALSVLTWTPVDLDALNRFFGTSLRPTEVTMLGVAPAIRRLTYCVPFDLGLFKWTLLFRMCKRIKDDYDVIIGNNNEADFGRRGIQIVMYPFSWPRPRSAPPWYRGGPLLTVYFKLCAHFVDFSFARMKQNLTLVNSSWTAARMRAVHGVESTVLYPPVAGVFPQQPWAGREDGFVCIGRIAPDKEIHKIIDIVSLVRARGHDVHLHIIGPVADRAYYRSVRRRADANVGWVRVEHELPRAELIRLVAGHRYGIHGMSEEHFGMAVGEMVRAGCIVFVPDGGGQVEIVGDQRLVYGSVETAADKIVAVLRSEPLQGELRRHLDGQRQLFSVDRFIEHVREIVRQFSETRPES